MLKQAPVRSESYSEQYDGGFVSYQDITRFATRYRLTIIAPVCLSLALAFAYILVQKPIYTARAELLIDSQLPTSVRKQSGNTGILLDTPQIESQVMVLRSEAIMTTVVRNLGLMHDPMYQDPNLNRSYLAQLWRKLAPPSSEYERLRRGISALQYGLHIRRIGLSYAIEISFRSHDPKEAARIANEVAQAFVQDQITTRSRAAREGSAWLETRIDELRYLMNSSALRVQRFKAKRDYRIVGLLGASRDATPKRKSDVAFARANNDQRTLNELESKANTYRKIYESFLEAYTESVQRQSFPVASARVITVATPPASKSHPKIPLILIFGATLGFLAGVGIALFRYNTDQSVTSPNQARGLTGIECLAQLPRVRKKLAPNGVLEEVVRSPFSRFSVEMHELKTAIQPSKKGKLVGSLAVTSALAAPGKSTMIANLAAMFAMSGRRVLVIDADRTFAQLSRTLAADAEVGLAQALNGSEPIYKCIAKCATSGISILPLAGPTAKQRANPPIEWDALPELLKGLEKKFELVLVDMPALQPMTGNRSIYANFGGVLFAIEWGKTPSRLATDAVRLLETTNARLVGSFLTNAPSYAMSLDRSNRHRNNQVIHMHREAESAVA